MKRISVKDASILSFVVRHQNASEEQVDSVLKKTKPSNRRAFKTARKASGAGKAKAKRLGVKTGLAARRQKVKT
jgi:hypothetical protein